MQILLLGRVEATLGDGPLRLAGERQRALIGILAIEKGKTVTTSRLLGALWGDNPPPTARTKLHGLVSSFRHTARRQLPDGGGSTAAEYLLTRPHGYELSAAGAEVDIEVFDRLVAQARQAGEAGEAGQQRMAAELLEHALGLWRGQALADVLLPGVRGLAEAIDERHLLAVAEKAELDLALGRCDQVAAELRVWVHDYPLRERLRALLMQALYLCGCRADALHVYRAGRDATVAELGLEPGHELRRMQHRILADESGPRA
jgi:DNA-binding SARP family transcriptional activator